MANELATVSEGWGELERQATLLLESGFLPKAINTPAKAIAIALKGRELGLPIMQSLSSIHVIDGKPTLAAEAMLALAYKRLPGFRFDVVEWTDSACTVEAQRQGCAPQRASFSVAQAQRAGLMGKDNWRKYPQDMVRWRAISRVLHVVAPDVLAGLKTEDEAEETLEGHVVSRSEPRDDPPKPLAPSVKPSEARERSGKGNGTSVATASAPASSTPAKAPAAKAVVEEAEVEASRRDFFARVGDDDLAESVWTREDGDLAGLLGGRLLTALRRRFGEPVVEKAGNEGMPAGRKWDEATVGELIAVVQALPNEPATVKG